MDGVGGDLQLLPMAARRALDACGRKLSLEAWRSLDVGQRRELSRLGSADAVDTRRVLELLVEASAPTTECAVVEEPSPAVVPADVQQAFGPTRPIPDAAWAALDPLDRYALAKIARRGRPERIDQAYGEIVGDSALSSHLAAGGGVRMVNVGRKPESLRTAVAESRVGMNVDAFERLRAHRVPKGDVLGTARLAGIMAAKKTAEWIPLCHPLRLTKIEVDLTLDPTEHAVMVSARVEAFDRTGVEMEALVAASAASLTIYDMLKSFDRGMLLGPTRVRHKSGGRSGDFDT